MLVNHKRVARIVSEDNLCRIDYENRPSRGASQSRGE
jgi:hypothetical protein